MNVDEAAQPNEEVPVQPHEEEAAEPNEEVPAQRREELEFVFGKKGEHTFLKFSPTKNYLKNWKSEDSLRSQKKLSRKNLDFGLCTKHDSSNTAPQETTENGAFYDNVQQEPDVIP